MVWIPKKTGSSISAPWAGSDSAEAKEAQTRGSYSVKKLRDKQSQGITPNQRGGMIRPQGRYSGMQGGQRALPGFFFPALASFPILVILGA